MKDWKSNYIALLAALVLALTGFSLSNPIIPLFLAEDIGIKDERSLKLWVGVISSCHALAMAVFAPIWGNLADVLSRRMMLLRAMFGGAIMTVLMVFVTSPWQVLALRAFSGCLTGTVAAATVLTIGIVPAAHIGFALGLLQTGVAVGNALGPLLGGVMADFLGYRVAFIGTSVALAIAGFIVLKGVEDDKRSKEQRGKQPFSLLPNIKPIVNSPILLSLFFVTFSIQAANTIASPMMPLYIRELVTRGLEKTGAVPQYIGSTTGLVLGLSAATTALAAVLVGKYCSRIGYWRTLVICLGLGAALQIPQALVTNVAQLAVFRSLASFFIGGSVPVLQALIASSTEKKFQGTVFGFNSSVSQTGGAVGPMIGSSVAILSYRAVFIATATLMGICACITRWRQHKRISPE